MTFTLTPITVKDSAGTDKAMSSYNDGTNNALAHPILNSAGTLIDPATQGTLASVLAALQSPASPLPLIAAGSTTTRPADTTAYTFNDLLANSTTAGSVTPGTIAAARGTDVASTILRCRLKKSGTTITNAIFRLHLYNVLPTVTNGDNGSWISTTAGYVGSMDVTIDKPFSDSSMGVGVPTAGSTIAFTPVSGTANLYYLIEVRAAYTPVSGEVFTPYLEVQ